MLSSVLAALALTSLTVLQQCGALPVSLPASSYTVLPSENSGQACTIFDVNASVPIYAFVTEESEARSWLAGSQTVPPLMTGSYAACAGTTNCMWASSLLNPSYNYTMIIWNPHNTIEQVEVDLPGCSDDYDYDYDEDYTVTMEVPANTVQAMIPFNGTDEAIFIIEECSTVSTGLMNITSFDQWNASGLSGTPPFLPGSQLSFQTTTPVNFTISGLQPQMQYLAVVQSPSDTDAMISMSLYLGSNVDVDNVVPADTVIVWGPFNGSTCLSYQYNSSSTLSSGILNETAFADWTPSLTGTIPAVSGTTCSADNCTVKATNLTATTAYFVALMNKQPQAASVYAIYAQGCNLTTQTKLENASLYTRLNTVDPVQDSYIYNFSTNASTNSAGRKLQASAPATATGETPTLYALPVGQKLSYQYVSQPLSAFEPTPEEEASPGEESSPEEEASPEAESPEESPAEEEASPEAASSPS